jgi:MFS family permease
MDQPVPAHTDAEIEAERDRNYRWNFTVNLADVAAFWFGLSFISSATIVPLYISKLTNSTIAIGLAAVITQGAWYLPQLFTANFVEGLARKKPMVVNLGFFLERLPMWFIVLSPIIAVWDPALALFVFLTAIAWHSFGAGIVATSWQDLIARCFPVERRGRFMGTSFFVGALTGAAAAGFSARLLTDFPFPTNFIYSFTIAALAITISWGFLALTREPIGPVTKRKQSNRQFWSDLPHILRRDVNYRRFLVARLLLALGGMGLGFVTVAAVKRWSIADGTVGTYTLTFLLGQMAGNLFTGFLADKRGHKLSLEIGALSSFLAFAIAWLAPAPEFYLVVFFLLGTMTGAVLVSGILVVMEFSRPERRPTYIGMTNTSVGVVSMIAPLIGAGLAAAGYNWLFAVSAFLSLLSAVALHWWVQEPRFKELVDSGQ